MSKQSSEHPDDKPRAPGHARRAKPYGLKCYVCRYGQTVWEEFQAVTRPVIEWLNKNVHPHTAITITGTSAELVEGICAYHTNDYVPD